MSKFLQRLNFKTTHTCKCGFRFKFIHYRERLKNRSFFVDKSKLEMIPKNNRVQTITKITVGIIKIRPESCLGRKTDNLNV